MIKNQGKSVLILLYLKENFSKIMFSEVLSMRISNEWKNYECIDAGNGEKLERWGNVILRRPEPLAMWPIEVDKSWKTVDGVYYRFVDGGGHWEFNKKLPDFWTIEYKNLKFKVSPTNFKHTGLFPEQATNWDFMMDKIRNAKRPIKVLNLFGYTGGATVACSKAGAELVVHVDAAKGMVEWAKENAQLSGVKNNYIRFLVDDCLKFVEREIRRGNKYDAIIMDPPSFGRGTNKEVWSIDKDLFNLVSLCKNLLVDEPLFFIINTYTAGLSKIVIENILKIVMSGFPGKISSYELGILGKDNLILPCGVCARYEK